ncbi:pentapeptide repeat-containing protein [Frankia sp. EAN1pec]|uniref:pentapeptide repeat-containing protein n=1 Tax=Parafrankia sp. (strain EAN1pec) TaxID=298653 RepID=UPI00059D097A
MTDNGGTRRPAGRRSLWIVAGLAAVGAVAAVVGIWHLPDRMYPPGTDGEAEARAALQGGLLTAAAALTAVAGALIALDETRQANAEVRRANAEVRRANENTHVRELYATAIGLLGADTIDSRLGGIYALERVAVDSPADQRTVVEVLSAFVRVHSTDPALRPAVPDPASPVRPAVDVHAAVTVLARLPVIPDIPRADLNGAKLTGPAALDRLQAARGNLAQVELAEADLRGARLDEADLADIKMVEVDFTGAQMVGANLAGAQMVEANFAWAELTRADFSGAQLVQADFTEAQMVGVNFTGAQLVQADFTGARLNGANLMNAEGVSQEQVDVAFGDSETRLPPGLTLPASWTAGGASGS